LVKLGPKFYQLSDGSIVREWIWIAPPNTALVLTGDLFDRGPAGLASAEQMFSMREQARAQKSDVLMTLGNHELKMFSPDPTDDVHPNEFLWLIDENIVKITKEERKYINEHRGAWSAMPTPSGHEAMDADRTSFKTYQILVAAWKERFFRNPKSKIGQLLSELPLAIQIGAVGYSHAGYGKLFAQDGGIADINRYKTTNWDLLLSGKAVPYGQNDMEVFDLMRGGFTTNRDMTYFSRYADSCDEVEQLFASDHFQGVRLFVAGHTPELDGEIHLTCNRIVTIDVAISRWQEIDYSAPSVKHGESAALIDYTDHDNPSVWVIDTEGQIREPIKVLG